MSAKKNPRRKGQKKAGDHSAKMMQARWKAGIGYSHDGGRRGSAKDVREAKTIRRRQRRRKENLQATQQVSAQ